MLPDSLKRFIVSGNVGIINGILSTKNDDHMKVSEAKVYSFGPIKNDGITL